MNIGDKVKWMHTSSSSRSLSFKTRCGVVESIEGDRAIVKQDGKSTRINISIWRLRPINKPSPVMDIFNAIASQPEAKGAV